MLESSNIRRLPAADAAAPLATSASYLITNTATKLWANLKALTDLGASIQVMPMGVPGNVGGGRRYRGARLRFFGAGADNSTFSVRIYSVQYIQATGGSDPAVFLTLLGTVDVTLSAGVGATGLPLISTDRIGDTLVWSEDADYTAELTALGSASPSRVNGTDTPATLRLPDVGDAGALLFDFDLGTATGAGVLAESIT